VSPWPVKARGAPTAHKEVLAPASASIMGHQHQWCPHPPRGEIRRRKSHDQWAWDEEVESLNIMVSSLEEVELLLLKLEKEPDLKDTDRWPELTEWCSSCTATRGVKLVLPLEEDKEEEEVGTATKEVAGEGEKVEKEEETGEERMTTGEVSEVEVESKEVVNREVVNHEPVTDASTQTEKKKKKGGRRSRLRRLLAFQLHLTVDKGLPLSRAAENIFCLVPKCCP